MGADYVRIVIFCCPLTIMPHKNMFYEVKIQRNTTQQKHDCVWGFRQHFT